MNQFLQTLASELITSIRCLEVDKSKTTAQEREKALQNILKVFEMKIDLNKKIIDGIFFSTINLLADKSLLESEKILILKVILKLFETFSTKPYFLDKSSENNNLIAFLVKLNLPNINVKSLFS